MSVCGVKNSGKTTYIGKIVEALKERNLSVAVIKHDGHSFEDCSTDTGKIYENGADATAVFDSHHTLILKREKCEFEDLIKKFKKYDVLLIEGGKNEKYPKVEIVRDGNSLEVVSNEENRYGIVTDIKGYRTKNEKDVILPLNDVTPLVEEILRRRDHGAR